MKKYNRREFIGLTTAGFAVIAGCGKSKLDQSVKEEDVERLKKINLFQYPLDKYFPDIPVSFTDPPKGEKYHSAEDSFVPAGTPVYAIGNGVIRYSGKMRGYGWLIIIDHPLENVYSLYGHLSRSRWRKKSGEVKKGELIAYIGDAEECDTMVSHIHFGMRTGQKADYPRWGDRRWMAGYTNSRPDLIGWLHPSEIIGQTESMKKWIQLIQKREDIVIGRNLNVSDFRITSGKYNEKEDLDQIIRSEFGDNFRLADWNEILLFNNKIEEWADGLGILEGEGNSLLISNDGYRFWLGRHYYISRFNHAKPENYLAHDTIDNDFVCLGSWFGINKYALAVKK